MSGREGKDDSSCRPSATLPSFEQYFHKIPIMRVGFKNQ